MWTWKTILNLTYWRIEGGKGACINIPNISLFLVEVRKHFWWMLEMLSRVALLRNSSYVKLSIHFTVHNSQFIVKSYELRLRVHSQ